MKPGVLYGVGVGPGDPELLTRKAERVLSQVDVVFCAAGANSEASVAGAVVDTVPGAAGKRRDLVFTMARAHADRVACWQANARLVAAELSQGRSCAFATIGDPFLYSTFMPLSREVRALVPGVEIAVVPGIAAFQALAAAAGEPLVEDREVLAIVPAWDGGETGAEALAAADTVVCLKTYRHRQKQIAALADHGLHLVAYGERLGLPDQCVLTDAAAVAAREPTYLSLAIAKRKAADG